MKKYRSTNIRSGIIIYLIVLILVSSFNLYSQSSKVSSLDENEIGNLVSKLQKKVLLTDSQAGSIKSILNSYSAETAKLQSGQNSKFSTKQDLINDSSNKIVSLLDEKQKMKFDIIKESWWKEIFSEEND